MATTYMRTGDPSLYLPVRVQQGFLSSPLRHSVALQLDPQHPAPPCLPRACRDWSLLTVAKISESC